MWPGRLAVLTAVLEDTMGVPIWRPRGWWHEGVGAWTSMVPLLLERVLPPGLTAGNCTHADAQFLFCTRSLVSSPRTAVQQRGLRVSASPGSLIELVSGFPLLKWGAVSLWAGLFRVNGKFPLFKMWAPKAPALCARKLNNFFLCLPLPLQDSQERTYSNLGSPTRLA